MGGTDDPSNLIELTVEEHAEAHRELWEQYEAHKGKSKHTEESKEKLRQFRTGMKLSEEHKRKIGEAGLGNKRCLGYKHTEETKEKVSKSLIGNKRWSSNPNVSEEERKRRSEASKERWRKYREAKGLDPDKPIDPRYIK